MPLQTFSTDPDLRVTLHFQRVNIRSRYSTYWLEVYDGQTDKSALVANYTFENGRTPESIYSRSNYMHVKLRFHCNYPSERKLQPIELQQLSAQHTWDQARDRQLDYEQQLYKNSPPLHPGRFADRPWQPADTGTNWLADLFSLEHASFEDKQRRLDELKRRTQLDKLSYAHALSERERLMQQSRIFCPHSGYDDITMYAMTGSAKHPDLVVLRSLLVNNTHSGLNATAMHSLVQLNDTQLSGNALDGLHVQAGAGDVSVSRSRLDHNGRNGANLTYAGGLKEFNHSTISHNGLYGLVVSYGVQQERDNLFQNTTLNDTHVEYNAWGGVWLGAYCNASNVTVNASTVRGNRLVGLLIESCSSPELVDWYVEPTRRPHLPQQLLNAAAAQCEPRPLHSPEHQCKHTTF